MFMSTIIYQPESAKTRRNRSCSNLGTLEHQQPKEEPLSGRLPKVKSAPKMVELTGAKGHHFDGSLDEHSSGSEELSDSNQSSLSSSDGTSLLSTSAGSTPTPPANTKQPSFSKIPQIQVLSATPTEPKRSSGAEVRFSFPGKKSKVQTNSACYAAEADDCRGVQGSAMENGNFDQQIGRQISADTDSRAKLTGEGTTSEDRVLSPWRTLSSTSLPAEPCISLEMCPQKNAPCHDDPPSQVSSSSSASAAGTAVGDVANHHQQQPGVIPHRRRCGHLYGPQHKADHSLRSAASVATMPMINSMEKCPKMWRADPTEPYPARARPKPIKFDIPSSAKTMANYFSVPSPTTPGTPRYTIGNEPIMMGRSERCPEADRATLPITSQIQHSISQSASANSLSHLGSLPNTPAVNSDFMPVYIATKDLEAAFLNEPPPQYGGPFVDQANRSLPRGDSNMLPALLNQINPATPKSSATVKRTKSFQQRIQRVFWGNEAPPPKAPLSMRMSILGKPLPQCRQTPRHFAKQRNWLYNFLQRPKSLFAYGYHFVVGAIIILNLLFFALSTVPDLEAKSICALRVLDIMILAILTCEFLCLFWASSCVSKYQGWGGKVRFVFSPFRILDLLIIGVTAVVVWTCWLNSHQTYLQWLRCGMIFQILRLENRFKPWRLLSSVLWIERKHLLITVYMGFLILVVISYVVYFLEQSNPDTLFTNLPVSLYWGVITCATVGYGDLAPTTTAGRTVGAILAICGAIVYAIPAGIIATGLALKVQERNREKHINKRRIPAACLIQCAWRCYAASVNSTSEATWKVTVKALCGTKSSGGHRKWLEMYNGSRFNLIDEDDHSAGGSNRNSHNDLSMHVGNAEMLSSAQKNAVRFIRAIKYEVALKQFKNAFKPYDIKDVLSQYSEGHADVVGRVRCMQSGINNVHMGLGSLLKMMQEMQQSQAEKIDRLERMMQLLVERLTAQQGEVPGLRGHQGAVNSPNNYSETSTICPHTPTLELSTDRQPAEQHEESNNTSQLHSFVWPNEVKQRVVLLPTNSPQQSHSAHPAEDSYSLSSFYSTNSNQSGPKSYRVASNKRRRHNSN